MSTDERRALAVIAALLVLAAGARWLERPRSILPDVPDVDLAALEEASRGEREGGVARPRARARGAPAERLDPNTASAAELDRLPGVGPALAARIIEERERAPFASLDDLRRVRGIGAALADKLARHVTLVPGATTPERTPGTAATPLARGPAAHPANVPAAAPDINEVSAEVLQRVPGVGPVLAARLIARRDSLGGFRSWDQVDAVAGVGPALLERLRRHVRVVR